MIQLQQEYERTTTIIPNFFIDEYMSEANGEFVKVYLYLLRCLSGQLTECSICSIADHCGHTENDVLRALKYWERTGLVRITYDKDDNVTGIMLCKPARQSQADAPSHDTYCVLQTSESKDTVSGNTPGNSDIVSAEDSAHDMVADSTAVIPTADNVNDGEEPNHSITAFRIKPLSSSKKYTKDEVDEFRKDPNVSELFYVIEMYLKHPIGASDTNTILYWYDELHFAPDLICYLVEYCISKGHSNLRYMDKVAMGWKESGITTVEQAKENAAAHSQAYYGVMKAFGISGRSLTEEETAAVTRWTKEYLFDLQIVLEACRRTMSAIHQPSFEYTEAILKDWHKNHVHTMEDIQALDKAYAKAKKSSLPAKEVPRRSNKFNNFNQRDYNYEQLEQYLLNTTVQ